MPVINTNLLSLKAQQNQGRASNGLSTSLERLASGLRVNGAKDDAAGQAIGNRMESNQRRTIRPRRASMVHRPDADHREELFCVNEILQRAQR